MKKLVSVLSLLVFIFAVSPVANAYGFWAGTIEPSIELGVTENDVDVTYTIKNQTPYVYDISFHSGQMIEYELYKDGALVERYSDLYMFDASMHTITLIQAEEKSFDFTIQDLEPGDYELNVWLHSEALIYQTTLSESFTIE
ncbi:BsuPI-related putative proteinase inhibitor [Bacillus carboniphilus]|uniref:Intracellular proteinase inhibitor BsuPI domain-containing protein n=1 Tax=Bacillus carboniphilus TaxID=86663 RepID=A0ABY9JU49_9BACI|nr:BsuPI-related putative proteinase inhibitor [Bacillus carboniphilus]WLR41823.1 BsuPI-related putative proteinase inhibitor [Bacillus carboniphilus]